MNNSFISGLYRLCVAGILLTLAGGCDALRSTKTAQPSFYTLDSGLFSTPLTVPDTAPTLIINPPHASSGFDTPRIIYVRETHRLEYYAHNEWIDTPARMLAPLIIAAVEGSGAFRAIVLTPSAAIGDLRLDTEIIRLQHEIGSHPSRVHFTLRAYIVENITRKVLGWKEFDEIVPVESEDPYGGVIAANRAVQNVLIQLAAFCVEAAAGWQALE
jgi:cholesterol transport system auxiliary component